MGKRVVLCLLVSFTCFVLHAQQSQRAVVTNSLSGVVQDSILKTPLASVTIYITDLKLGAITDSAGHYRFYNLPKGIYLIEVRATGYKSVAQSIVIKDVTTADFALKEDFIEGSDVVVTGFSKAMQIKRNPVPIISVGHDYITHNLGTNVVDIIAKLPGIKAVTTGPNISKPFIRGLGYNRILTLYDGLRQEGQQWGDEHGIEIDDYHVEKIEIIKGPASLSYGSDALAGVINIIPSQPVPEGTMMGDITTQYQTNSGQISASAMLGSTGHGTEWLARVSHKKAADYRNKYDGRVFGTAFSETDANVSLGLHNKWGYSHLHLTLYNNLQEVPDGSRDSATRRFTRQLDEDGAIVEIVPEKDLKSYKIENIHQRIQHYRAYLNNSFVLKNGDRIGVNIGLQRSVRREFDHPTRSEIPGLYLKLNTYTYDVKYYFPEYGGWNITAGVNGMYQNNNGDKGTDFIIPSYTQFDVGPFIMAKKSFGKMEIAGGIRYDIRSFKNKDLYVTDNPATGFDMVVFGVDTIGAEKKFSRYNKIFSGISASIGVGYVISEKLSFKANISRGYRAPNISEISSNGVHPGTNMYQLGNQYFKPEFSLQEDLGFEYATKQVVATLSIFNNNISNYIYNQKLTGVSGGDSVIVQGNQTFQYQAARARLYGGELSIDLHPIKAIHFENSISFVYGSNKGVKGKQLNDSAQYLPFIPPTHGMSELRYDFNCKPLNVMQGFIKAQVEYYAVQNRVFLENNTESPTNGYALLNAGIGGSFINKKGTTVFDLYVMVNNIFNTAYQDHLSRLKYMEPYPNNTTGRNGIYNTGRNVSVKIRVPFHREK